jgi:RNA polymerase primary sigma factor
MQKTAKQNTAHWVDQREIITYLQDVRKYPTLTREQEFELIKKIKEGCQKSKDLLIYSNLRFVITTAKQYLNQGLGLNDLISEGNYGLIKAAERFNYDQTEVRFLSYAVWWIRQSILQSLHENSRAIRLPVNKITMLNDYRKNMQPEIVDVDPYAALKLPTTGQLDQPIDEEGNSFYDVIEDSSCERVDLAYPDDRKQLTQQLINLLSSLNESESYVITKHFGLDCEPVSLQEISEDLELTKERVRQIKEKAIKKLRYNCAGLFELL